MNTRLFSIVFSIIIRGLLLSITLIFVLLFFYGYTPLMNSDIFTHLYRTLTTFYESSILSENTVSILRLLIPFTLLFLLPIYIKTKGLYIGLIKFIVTYSSVLLIILILSHAYIIYYKYINVNPVDNELICLATLLGLLLFNSILVIPYPLLAISIVRVNRNGSVESIDTRVSEIRLEPGELVRIKIYGESSSIGIRSDPENSMKISSIGKTLFYKYIDIYPLSSFGGYIELFYRDKLIHRFKCIYSNIEYRKIKFNIYFNDDNIGTYEVSLESHKNLLESFDPLLDSIISKLGVNRSDISNIVFYTKDKIHIPRETKISDLVGVDEVDVKLYSIEKYMEIYKYYSKSDVYELWEKLVKRLEFLRRDMNNVLSEIEESIGKAKLLYNNWW